MGEDQDTTQDRVTIQEAARRLGVKEDAVRKRIQRGTLRHEKTGEGRVLVWVNATQDASEDTHQDATQDTLLAAKDETIATLREQLEAERRANEENRRLLAALIQRVPELEAPPEPPEAPVSATPQPGRVEPQTPIEGAQEPVNRRYRWWQFWR